MNPLPVSNNSDWLEVGAVDDIPRLGARIVKTARGNIAVFRNAEDEIFALDDHCPHKGGPLSQGLVYGHTVACPLHNWCIDLHSGCAIAPDEGQTKRYDVKVQSGIIYLALSPST